jgi:hypothetical protein
VLDQRRQLTADVPRPEVAQLAQGGGVEGPCLTPLAPSARSRVRISPAARAVKVTASTRWGTYTPVATP